MRKFGSTVGVCCLGALCVFTSNASATTIELSAGHTDLGLAYEGGELELHYHFGVGAVLDGVSQVVDSEGQPGDAYVRISGTLNDKFGALPAVPFLGTNAGDVIWWIPQSGSDASLVGSPFLGISAVEAYNNGILSATLAMTGFSGPGEFAAWQDGISPTIFLDTVDGVGPDDVFSYPIHDHVNFGFSQEGVYEIEFTATGDTGSGLVQDIETFTFVIGGSTPVPEPSSFALSAAFTAGLLLCRRRRR